MNGLMYFISGKLAPKERDAIERFGLRYALGESAWPNHVMRHGPDGGGGLMLGPRSMDVHRVKIAVEEQTWRKMPGVEVWVGYWNDGKPGPADLLRETALAGPSVLLGDGNRWRVPLVRALTDDDPPAGYINLPARLELGDDGKWFEDGVDPRYDALWQIAKTWWEARTGQIDTTKDEDRPIRFTTDGIVTAATAVLGYNYRVAAAEVRLLDLLTVDNCTAVLDAMTSWTQFTAWLDKKKAETASAGTPGSGSSDGGTD